MKEVFNGSETSLIYVGRSGCSYCRIFAPILEQIVENYDVLPYYVNSDEVSFDDIIALDEDYFNDIGTNNLGTPLVLIVKDGTILKNQIGASSYETFEEKVKEYFDAK
jgi:predicted bacteriocin transport accessory protein